MTHDHLQFFVPKILIIFDLFLQKLQKHLRFFNNDSDLNEILICVGIHVNNFLKTISNGFIAVTE